MATSAVLVHFGVGDVAVLIAGSSRGCPLCTLWMHTRTGAHSQLKPAAMFYLPLPAAESLQGYLRIALLASAGLFPQPAKAILYFIMTHIPQLTFFLPIFSPLLEPNITLLSGF